MLKNIFQILQMCPYRPMFSFVTFDPDKILSNIGSPLFFIIIYFIIIIDNKGALRCFMIYLMELLLSD